MKFQYNNDQFRKKILITLTISGIHGLPDQGLGSRLLIRA